MWRVVLALASVLSCLGCTRWNVPAAEFPGDESEPALEHAIAKLALGPRVVDPKARCQPQPSPSLPDTTACAVPHALGLARAELRDLRRERGSWYLADPERYERITTRLEAALVRSRPRTFARRKLLGWLITAADRRRESRSGRASDGCGAHYLALLARELGPGQLGATTRYTLALETERLGRYEDAHGIYAAILDEEPPGSGRAAAHAALGDAAFRASFCSQRRLSDAHRHYLAAAHGVAPAGSPFSGYARWRLAQVEHQLGATGPALRQVEIAEAELGVAPGAPAGEVGRRRAELRRRIGGTLVDLLVHALDGGTLRLLLGFEPPGWSVCNQLELLLERRRDAALEEALDGPCAFTRADRERRCVTQAGCSLR